MVYLADLARLQTRMQIINPTPSAVYNGVLHGTYRIATGEGVMNLWRGMSSVIVGAGTPGNGGFSPTRGLATDGT